jgi:DNA repair exonuclease SbcCD ATPase subunit
MSKVIRLQAENFKRLHAVDITPSEDNVIVIEGKNAQGKSSVVDAIWAALQGSTAMKKCPKPIRDGQRSAKVELDVDSMQHGDLKITRTWSKKSNKTKLTVENANGEMKSPQGVLDRLISDLCFEPLKFLSKNDRDQVDTLISFAGIDKQIAEYDEERAAVYDERKIVNRSIRDKKGELEGLRPPSPKLPKKQILVGKLTQEYQEAITANAESEQIQDLPDELRDKIGTLEGDIQTLEQALEGKKQTLQEWETELGEAVLSAAKAVTIDTDSIKAKIEAAGETNAAIVRAETYKNLKTNLAEYEEEAEGYTQRIQELDSLKQLAIDEANLPVDGLAFDFEEGYVTFHGMPLSQCSTSERLRCAIAIAMATNPELKIMRIEDGNVLDAESLQLVKDMAKEHDYQVWLEMVGGDGTGVIIEDGERIDA